MHEMHEMHSDHPTLIDKLDRKQLIERKAKQIIDCQPPHCFGIHGGWGSGKTSFLQQLRYHLDGEYEGLQSPTQLDHLVKGKHEENVVTVWFDAWRYQHEVTPIIALLHEIRRRFSTWIKIKESAGKLAEVTTRSLLNGFSDMMKMLNLEMSWIKPHEIEKIGKTWEKEHLADRLGTDTIQTFLQEAIHALLGNNKNTENTENKRLVIFIDDLDRCNPSAAYKLLEGLKIYLDINNCVFVIGMNQDVVIDAIVKERNRNDKEEVSERMLAEAYLEKICFSIERLPPPINSKALFCDWVDQEQSQDHQQLLADINGFLPPNPRKIKALANVVKQWQQQLSRSVDELNFALAQQESAQQENAQPKSELRAIIALAYTYQFHSEIFLRWQLAHTQEQSQSFVELLLAWLSGRKSGDKLPIYLKNLSLPMQQVINDESETTVKNTYISAFPEPDELSMFWAQPLFVESPPLNDNDFTAIMSLITEGKIKSEAKT